MEIIITILFIGVSLFIIKYILDDKQEDLNSRYTPFINDDLKIMGGSINKVEIKDSVESSYNTLGHKDEYILNP
jgi:hypothetical protein